MSERQAKKLRKQTICEPAQKKPVNKQKVWFNVVSVFLIIAAATLAVLAIWNTKKSSESAPTFEEALTQQGLDFDTAVSEWGLDTNVFTPEMTSEDASMEFTLENYAKMNGQEIGDFLESLELSADVQTNIPGKELPTSVMLKINGIDTSVEELRAYGLSEDITENTVWSQAYDAVFEAVIAMYSEESQTQTDTSAEGAE